MSEQWVAVSREAPDMEVLAESALAMAQATMQNAMDQAGISKAALARGMDRPRSFISRMLGGNHNLTIKTMARALAACGYEIDFGLTPVRWNWAAPAEQLTFVCDQVPAQEGTLVLASYYSSAEGCSPLVGSALVGLGR